MRKTVIKFFEFFFDKNDLEEEKEKISKQQSTNYFETNLIKENA